MAAMRAKSHKIAAADAKEVAAKTAKELNSVLSGFRDFALRGNALELAVGVVIGGAFTALVNALVNSVINPLIAALFGKPDIADLFVVNLNGSLIKIGAFANAAINFVIVAAALYFCIILPINKLVELTKKHETTEAQPVAEEIEEDLTREEKLLREIRDLLKPTKKSAFKA